MLSSVRTETVAIVAMPARPRTGVLMVALNGALFNGERQTGGVMLPSSVYAALWGKGKAEVWG